MQKIFFFLIFMIMIGLSTGLYAVIFHRSIDLWIFSLPWQVAGGVYLGGAVWLIGVAWETRSS